MNLHKLLLTNNDCYKAGQTIDCAEGHHGTQHRRK